jgi:hypothetical protein
MQFDLEEPRFTPAETLACVPGLGVDAFKQWIQRRTVTLSARESAKRGRTPLYRGTDVIQVAAIHELTRQGMMASKATLAWQTVLRGRLIAWRTGLAIHDPPYGRSVFFWLHPETDELMAQDISENDASDSDGSEDVDAGNRLNHPDAPDVMIMFRVDRFIVRMIERMQKVKAGKPAVEAQPPAGPSPFIGWAQLQAQGELGTDDQGRPVRSGLTHEETIEWLRIVNLDMIERLGGPPMYPTHEEKMAARDREIELEDKRMAAMMYQTVKT